MGTNVVFFAWDRPIPGREHLSAAHFQEFVHYLGGLQQAGAIQSFEAVFIDNHGGDLNGFFLIRAQSAQLDAVVSSTEWETHMTRAALHLNGSGAVRGVTGEMVLERMQLWTSLLPA